MTSVIRAPSRRIRWFCTVWFIFVLFFLLLWFNQPGLAYSSPLLEFSFSSERIKSSDKPSNETKQGVESLTNRLLSIPIGSSSSSPSWTTETCPDAIAFFEQNPYFEHFDGDIPIMTTSRALELVCLMKITHSLAASIGTYASLYGSTHLGALQYGAPVPWIDDAAMTLSFTVLNEFLNVCSKITSIPVVCRQDLENVPVVSVRADDATSQHDGTVSLKLIFYKIENVGTLVRIPPGEGSPSRHDDFAETDFLPLQTYSFAGLKFHGPPQSLLTPLGYDLDRCLVSEWSHRLDKRFDCGVSCEVDCEALAKFFPPTRWSELPRAHMSTRMEKDMREAWRQAPPSEGYALSEQLKPHGLNQLIIDNDINVQGCTDSIDAKNISVIEFNAERGRRWLESVPLLKDFDIVILNEMDVGMARTGQQNTIHELAHALRMNYIWGIEFVELTNGDLGEQRMTAGQYNFDALHTNAILSRCRFNDSDTLLVRDQIGDYFSNKRIPLNADGYEKRLGGRMGFFVSTDAGIVVGVIHKISEKHKPEIMHYFGNRSVVVAGDQRQNFCGQVGLNHIGSTSHHTWPASCTTFGRSRGDIICSNMAVARDEQTILPCVPGATKDVEILLSDHALTFAHFHRGLKLLG